MRKCWLIEITATEPYNAVNLVALFVRFAHYNCAGYGRRSADRWRRTDVLTALEQGADSTWRGALDVEAKAGGPRVTTTGTQLHNRVHVWVGGNMILMASPDDPVFFLHHCFVDKVWADWQAAMAENKPDWAPHYAPLRDGPSGHNLEDVLRPWSRKIKDAFSIAALGYEYEQPAQIMEAALEPTRKAIRSPFME